MKYSKWLLVFSILLASRFAFADTTEIENAQKSLYERLGGEQTITAVVDDFVNRAIADPAVNFIREGKTNNWTATPENVVKLKKRMVQFISVATGATDALYEGEDMKTVHEGMKISGAEFDTLMADMKPALEKANVIDPEAQELLDILGTTRNMIVEQQS